MPHFAPPPGFMPPPPGAFPPFAGSPAAMPSAVGTSPFPPPIAGLPARPPFLPPNPALAGGAAVATPAPPAPVSAPITATVMPPKDGVMWPDAEASPVCNWSQRCPFQLQLKLHPFLLLGGETCTATKIQIHLSYSIKQTARACPVQRFTTNTAFSIRDLRAKRSSTVE